MTVTVTSLEVENSGTIRSKYSDAKGSTVFIGVLSVLQRLTDCEPVAEGMTIASELSPVMVAVPIPLREALSAVMVMPVTGSWALMALLTYTLTTEQRL